MAQTFFFYDLETTGVNPRNDRIMQFAGVRTDMHLQPVGDEHDYLIRLNDDVLPQPDAILITGITPQKAIAEGMYEAEFLKLFYEKIALPDTIFVGFNTVRFDDEFMRYLMYRNFYDPYEWEWSDGRSRWDILDAVRMTRALRPDGIQWPFDSSGAPTNRLELLTELNKLSHENAHDALSDVHATIAVAQLLRSRQPKLFDYLLRTRGKEAVKELVTAKKPFVYTSGKYSGEFEKTTIAAMVAEHPQTGALVFDLRHEPEDFVGMSPVQLAEGLTRRRDDPGVRVPVKTLKYNRCPAVAPLAVVDEPSWLRLGLDKDVIRSHFMKLQKHAAELGPKLIDAIALLDKKQQTRLLEDQGDVDTRLYDGFFDRADKDKMRVLRGAEPKELATLTLDFKDDRLNALLPLYRARNYPGSLTDEERQIWEDFRQRKLFAGGDSSRATKYFQRLAELAQQTNLSDEKRYLLEELQLYGQSIMPTA